MVKRTTRREFIKVSAAGASLVGLHSCTSGRVSAADANSEIRLAIIGLGGLDVVGGVGGRGRQLIDALRDVPGARITAICDVDESIRQHQIEEFRKSKVEVKTYSDLRQAFDDQDVDAVIVATPNHWHALATVWACQAGKDVYVEKPFSHDLWEGRQAVAAARKYGRMVQVGMQRRSRPGLPKVAEFLRSGEIGPMRCVHAIVYRSRKGIGTVTLPTPIPATVDYDLWCGPVAKAPLMRKQLHYEWHWFWSTGNGEIGNNGIHTIDVARMVMNQDGPPPRAMSIGGRYGVDDVAETPNTQVAIMDYEPAPLICEIRNLDNGSGGGIGQFRGLSRGLVIDCEGGYVVEGSSGLEAFDHQGKSMKQFASIDADQKTVSLHLSNFLDAIRSRDASVLNAESQEGDYSAACFHLANVSHRLGSMHKPEEILERTKGNPEFSDAFERCQEHLKVNGVDLASTGATVGPWVTYHATQGRFTGEFAEQANRLSRKEYRKPFEVPKLEG